MRSAIRKPSPRKSLSARTTGKAARAVKKSTTPLYGAKGTGVIKNPKKAVYNQAYSHSSIGVQDISKSCNRKSNGGSSSHIEQSTTVIVTNENLAEILSEHPEIVSTLFGCFVRRLFWGILFLVLGIALLSTSYAFSIILFIIAGILFYRSRKFFFAYSDARELS